MNRRAFLTGGFLGDALRREEPSRPGVAVLDRGACLAWEGTFCMTCKFVCPESAISLDARNRPRVTEACTGCEKCIEVCPTKAITSV